MTNNDTFYNNQVHHWFVAVEPSEEKSCDMPTDSPDLLAQLQAARSVRYCRTSIFRKCSLKFVRSCG